MEDDYKDVILSVIVMIVSVLIIGAVFVAISPETEYNRLMKQCMHDYNEPEYKCAALLYPLKDKEAK